MAFSEKTIFNAVAASVREKFPNIANMDLAVLSAQVGEVVNPKTLENGLNITAPVTPHTDRILAQRGPDNGRSV